MYYISRVFCKPFINGKKPIGIADERLVGVVDTNDNVEEIVTCDQLRWLLDSGVQIQGASRGKTIGVSYPIGDGWFISLRQCFGSFDTKLQALYGINVRMYKDIITYMDITDCSVESIPLYVFSKSKGDFALVSWQSNGGSIVPTFILSDAYDENCTFYSLEALGLICSYDIRNVRRADLLNKIYYDCLYCFLNQKMMVRAENFSTRSSIVSEISLWLKDWPARLAYVVNVYFLSMVSYAHPLRKIDVFR